MEMESALVGSGEESERRDGRGGKRCWRAVEEEVVGVARRRGGDGGEEGVGAGNGDLEVVEDKDEVVFVRELKFVEMSNSKWGSE